MMRIVIPAALLFGMWLGLEFVIPSERTWRAWLRVRTWLRRWRK